MKSEKILVGLVTQIVKMHAQQIANKKLGNTLLMEKMEAAENSNTIASCQLRVKLFRLICSHEI